MLFLLAATHVAAFGVSSEEALAPRVLPAVLQLARTPTHSGPRAAGPLLVAEGAPTAGERSAERFPTPSTRPEEVVVAQLAAMRERDFPTIFALFSRARREILQTAGRAHGRGTEPSEDFVHARVARVLEEIGPELLGHERAELVSALQDRTRDGAPGFLPRWRCRVRVWPEGGPSATFKFTLTQRSRPEGVGRTVAVTQLPTMSAKDPPLEDFVVRDPFDGCWLVWSIKRDEGGDNDDVESRDPSPSLFVPAR